MPDNDLISLIAENRSAMDYFKSLPDSIKVKLVKMASRIDSLETLKAYAEQLSTSS